MTERDKNILDYLVQLVSFKVGEEEFGVDILRVQEINRMVEITKVPRAPQYCEGVINLRGKVIPVIDLRMKFGLGSKKRSKDSRIVVCDVNGIIIGMIVDAVEEVLRIPNTMIDPAPEIVTSVESDYIRGVAKLDDRLVILLDIGRVVGEVDTMMNETDAKMV